MGSVHELDFSWYKNYGEGKKSKARVKRILKCSMFKFNDRIPVLLCPPSLDDVKSYKREFPHTIGYVEGVDSFDFLNNKVTIVIHENKVIPYNNPTVACAYISKNGTYISIAALYVKPGKM